MLSSVKSVGLDKCILELIAFCEVLFFTYNYLIKCAFYTTMNPIVTNNLLKSLGHLF